MLGEVAQSLHQSLLYGDPSDDRWFELAVDASCRDWRLDRLIWRAVDEILDQVESAGEGANRSLPASIGRRTTASGTEEDSSRVARRLYESIQGRDPDADDWWGVVWTISANKSIYMAELIWRAVKQIVDEVERERGQPPVLSPVPAAGTVGH